MQRYAFCPGDVADRHGREEVRLAFDRRGGLTGLEVGGCCGATQIVRKRHQGAAMHDAETVIKIIARYEFCRHPFGRNMGDLEAERCGQWRLFMVRFFLAMLPACESKP